MVYAYWGWRDDTFPKHHVYSKTAVEFFRMQVAFQVVSTRFAENDFDTQWSYDFDSQKIADHQLETIYTGIFQVCKLYAFSPEKP